MFHFDSIHVFCLEVFKVFIGFVMCRKESILLLDLKPFCDVLGNVSF